MIKPFIRKFRTSRHYYVYDVNSNQILRVNKIEYDIIDDVQNESMQAIIDKQKNKYPTSIIRKAYVSIRKARIEHQLFSNNRPTIFMGIKSENDVKKALRSDLRQIILELTQKCNLRCKYCIFSGKYEYSRSHSPKDMPYDTARKAIDYFLPRCRGTPSPGISFYGGEPLLKIDLIRQILKYIKEIEQSEKHTFSLTTNGVLLTDETIDYFAENNISMLVSLDGPKEMHDRYRVFKNGKGTFDIIIENLLRIKERHQDYFLNHISIAATLAPRYELNKTLNFFYNNKLFEQITKKINVNPVDPYKTTFFDDFSKRAINKIYLNTSRLFSRYKKALASGTYDTLTVEKGLFDKDFYDIEHRIIEPLGDYYFPRGTCFPGRRRLFVSVEGKYYMCEKVGTNYEIGNVEEGFNYRRIYSFIKKYKEFFSDCKDCWALRLCSKCFDHVKKGEKLDERRKKEYCSNGLEILENYLVAYCEVKEKKPSAFRVLDSIIIQ